MRIRWTPAAACDLQSISNYLKEHHPQYRQATMRKIYDRPMPYIAVYRVNEQTIEVWCIYHTSQERR
jgi:plasmid stabilization system protein ParE